jgi:hypothetical protein
MFRAFGAEQATIHDDVMQCNRELIDRTRPRMGGSWLNLGVAMV